MLMSQRIIRKGRVWVGIHETDIKGDEMRTQRNSQWGRQRARESKVKKGKQFLSNEQKKMPRMWTAIRDLDK